MKSIVSLFASFLLASKLFAAGCTPPVITSQPSDVVVCENANTFFQVVVTGPSLSYQWQMDQGLGFVNLSNVAPFSGVTTDLLNITSVPLTLDNSTFRCIVTNGCAPDDTSIVVLLKINSAPSITTQPSNTIICEGNNGTILVNAAGTGLAYQWQVNDGSGFINVPSGLPYSGETTASLVITGNVSLNGYTYQCIVSGSCSPNITSSIVTLTINTLPNISAQPNFVVVCDGNATTIGITASGTGISYQWQVNQGSGYSNLTNTSPYTGVTTQTLSINPATTGMNGYLYQCIVSGACSPADTSYEIPLIVNPTYSLFTNATICQGDTMFFGTSNLTAPGFYSYNFTSVSTCDSLVYLSLAVNSAYLTSVASVICSGDSISLGGVYQTTAGMYTYVLPTINGCDSTIENTLSVNPSYNFNDSTMVCAGDSAMVFGTYETIDSIYTDNYSTFLGCDSIYSFHLIVNPVYNMAVNANVCAGDSVLIGASFESVAGTYINNYVSLFGCDSIVTTLLIVHPNDSISQSISICSYDSILLAGAYQTTAGVYTDNLISSFGCDSVVTTTLSINIAPSVVFDQVVITCDTAAAFVITGGSPVGGSYSGTGVSAGMFSPAVAGLGAHNITYTYTDSAGCSDAQTSTIIVTACTGINDISSNADFSFYPNPFSDVLTISSTSNAEMKLSIVNVLGQLVHSSLINNGKTEIDLSQIASGIYFAQIITEEKIISKKICKR